MATGNRIRMARLGAGLSVKQVARQLGITHQGVSWTERSRRVSDETNARYLVAISRAAVARDRRAAVEREVRREVVRRLAQP